MLFIDKKPNVNFGLDYTAKSISVVPPLNSYRTLRSQLKPAKVDLQFGSKTIHIEPSEWIRHVHPFIGVIWEYRVKRT